MEDSDQEDMMDEVSLKAGPPSLAGQNAALYGEANQLNPKAVRAAKRKAKKSKQATDDFDFDEFADAEGMDDE